MALHIEQHLFLFVKISTDKRLFDFFHFVHGHGMATKTAFQDLSYLDYQAKLGKVTIYQTNMNPLF